MTDDDEEISVLHFRDLPERKTFILKPKPDITPREVLDILIHLIATINGNGPHLEGEITVHFDEDYLHKFDANTLRHFEPDQ